MAVSVRGRSSVMPCLDQYGRLSTLCLLLGWQMPAHRGAVGSVVPDILSSILVIHAQKRDGSICFIFLQRRNEYMIVQSTRCALCFGFALLLLRLQMSFVCCLGPKLGSDQNSSGMGRIGD